MKEPQSIEQRRIESIKNTNHYYLTCKDKNYIFLVNKEHDYKNLLKRYMDYSYTIFLKKESEQPEWILPNFQSSLFKTDQKYEATFIMPVLTRALDELADEAEEQTQKLNQVGLNLKWQNYYFYKYLSLYHEQAIQNFRISEITKEQVIKFITSKILDTFTLA